MASSSGDRRGRHGRHVVALPMAHGVSMLEVAVACEVFGIDRSDLGVPWYELRVCAAVPPPLRTSLGFTVYPDLGLDALRTADTIVVPPHDEEPREGPLLDELRQAHARGARIISLCTGAMILAAAGLLDGRRATTHWAHTDDLAARYSQVTVEPDVLYVDEGDILTSAGAAASMDLCLHVVRRDHGAEIANALARRIVVPPHRDGGQAQFIDQPLPSRAGSDLLGETLEWMERNVAEPLTVEQLASHAAMSPRTFARRFRETTGTTPHRWLQRQRVLYAQRMLETTEAPVELIAQEAGLGTAANLRLHFQQVLATTPTAYRRTFTCCEQAS